MMTLEDHLVALGQEPNGLHPCGCCANNLPAFALVRENEADDWTCGQCITSRERHATALVEAAAPVDRRSWDSEAGLALKAERNRLLDQWAWSIRPDSPLSVECQAACLDYLKALQSMTARHATVLTWEWPEVPCLAFAETFDPIPAPEGLEEPEAPVVPPTVDPEPIEEPPVIEAPVEVIPLPPLAPPEPWVEPEPVEEEPVEDEGLEPDGEDPLH